MAIQEQTDLSSIISDIMARIRVLESKYSLFGERVLIINKNMINQYQKLTQEVKVVNQDIQTIKGDIENIKEILKKTVSEMENFARKENLMVLEKYINFWNPLNFVTQEELKKILKK